MSDELLALAKRCEQASKPDNVLNRAIARAVGWGYRTPSEAGRKSPAWFHPDDCRDGKPVLDSLHGTDVWREPSPYVFSLDAALTLVPEGMVTNAGNDVRNWAFVWLDTPDYDGVPYEGRADTLALAIAAAALRARAASTNATDDGAVG